MSQGSGCHRIRPDEQPPATQANRRASGGKPNAIGRRTPHRGAHLVHHQGKNVDHGLHVDSLNPGFVESLNKAFVEMASPGTAAHASTVQPIHRSVTTDTAATRFCIPFSDVRTNSGG